MVAPSVNANPGKVNTKLRQAALFVFLLLVGLILLTGLFWHTSGSLDKNSQSKSQVIKKAAVSPQSSAISRETLIKRMGFTKTVLKDGNGQKPEKGQYVTVHCTGYGKNRDLGVKFWSTKDPGQQPFTFRVGMGEVIKGWDESVIGMSIGEVAKIHCSPDYAYGSSGFPAWGIMPDSELVFEIEVLKYSYTQE